MQCYRKAVATSGRSSSSLSFLTAALEEMEQTRARAMVLMTARLALSWEPQPCASSAKAVAAMCCCRPACFETMAALWQEAWLSVPELMPAGPTGGCCRFWRSSLKKESRPCECLRRDVRASWCCYLRYPVERFPTLPIAFLAVGCSTVEAYSRAK